MGIARITQIGGFSSAPAVQTERGIADRAHEAVEARPGRQAFSSASGGGVVALYCTAAADSSAAISPVVRYFPRWVTTEPAHFAVTDGCVQQAGLLLAASQHSGGKKALE